MKARLKNYITTIIGILFMILSGFMFWFEKETTAAVIVFGIGLAGLFAKDDLIKAIISKL